jgi:hypothetical protein
LAELEVGEKFAEGGQAELFHVHVTWANPKFIENDFKDGVEFVLKVFKKGTLLRHLQSQWPLGYLEWWAKDAKQIALRQPSPFRFHCDVLYGTLLKDGRFAFLMVKEQEDLCNVIDRKRNTNIGGNHGPFQQDGEDAEVIMYQIALGMNWLHSCNIIHRDLKTSNVLMKIADFECSIEVVGTGFWRAPKILQAIKDGKVYQKPEIFSKEADIYAYGMTCYEILTGILPFEGHPWRDYNLVLNGERPEVPKYVDDWACQLLDWCWHSNPAKDLQ